MTSKNGLHVILPRLGAIFAQNFGNLAEVFTDFTQICIDFARMFKDFAQIFNISKLLGVRLHPLHPHLLHH